MGYFKQQQIAEQEDVDRLVAWYAYHRDKLPKWYLEWLLEDSERLWANIEFWEDQPTRDAIRDERAAERVSNTVLWLNGVTIVSLLIVVTVLAVAVFS